MRRQSAIIDRPVSIIAAPLAFMDQQPPPGRRQASIAVDKAAAADDEASIAGHELTRSVPKPPITDAGSTPFVQRPSIASAWLNPTNPEPRFLAPKRPLTGH
jgi:hypothetical protein